MGQGQGGRRSAYSMLAGCLLAAATGAAQAAQQDLTELDLDALLDIEVTSVSKRAEPLGHAAAAIHVITAEEIRRSGVRSIPEALRLAPGMNVARTSSNSYVISARGFQNTSDKLQVLIDGRSVYTPLTSSVFWEVLDLDIGSIERIEIIRGPGATLWGANAVNGVINVITRPASETLGGEFEIAGGNEDLASASLRAGGSAGENGSARFYARAHETDTAATVDGGDAVDGQRQVQGGARGDWQIGNTQLRVSGDLYSARGQAQGVSSPSVPTDYNGANLDARAVIDTGDLGLLSATLSYDHYTRDIPEAFREKRDTYDLGLQHELQLGQRHQLTWGLGYRHSSDETGGPPLAINFLPAERDFDVISGFVQDQIALGDNLAWTLGSKIEHNDFSGTEVQPGTRLGWTLNPDWFTWAAVSKAVRTPNRADHDLAFNCTPPLCDPALLIPVGNPDFDSEELLAYEWGLRYAGGTRWSADLATFYNDYKDLRSYEINGTSVSQQNRLRGRGAGGEVSLAWRPMLNMDLLAFYSYLDISIRQGDSIDSTTPARIEGGSPRHQAGLRYYYRPAQRWTTDAFLRYVGRIERAADDPVADTSVPSYTELNLRIAYSPRPRLELAVIGENLLHDQHAEYGAAPGHTELERSLLLALSWNWP